MTHMPSFLETATQLGVNPALLHELVLNAKQSDDAAIRYGTVLKNKSGKVIGVGWNHKAAFQDEIPWTDKNGIVHSEMAALRDAERRGYAMEEATLYVLPITPAGDTSSGHLILRSGEHAPCFSCASCAPQLAKHGITTMLLHDTMGWVAVPPEQVVAHGEEAERLQQVSGKKLRSGFPGSSRTEAPLIAPGYHFAAYPVADLDQITYGKKTLALEGLYAKVAQLEVQLQRGWSAETTGKMYQEKWNCEENPALGQCAVTAEYVRKKLGGQLIRVVARDGEATDSHYFNLLPNGTRIDFTRRQFSRQATFEPPLESSNEDLLATTNAYVAEKNAKNGTNFESIADYALSFPDTKARYDLLVERCEGAKRAADKAINDGRSAA